MNYSEINYKKQDAKSIILSKKETVLFNSFSLTNLASLLAKNVCLKDTNRLIIYLEPCRKSKLRSSIEKYYDVSKKLIGYNEAPMYHPHSSMIGFIDMGLENNKALKELTKIITNFMKLNKNIKQELSPIIEDMKIVKRNNKIDLRFTSSYKLKQLVLELSQHLLDLGLDIPIRSKPIDHISLAYTNHYIKTEPFDDFILDEYLELAQNLIDLSELNNTNWNIVLYNQTTQSTSCYYKHAFRQLYKI